MFGRNRFVSCAVLVAILMFAVPVLGQEDVAVREYGGDPISLDVQEAEAVDLTLAPGEAVFFSGLLVHGSAPNRGTRRRIAILTDYTAAQARQSAGRGSGQLLRGADAWGHIAPEPVPTGSCTPPSVLARRNILRRYPEKPLMGPLAPGETPEFPDQPEALGSV